MKFAGPRLQPGLDLLARIPEVEARRIVDLGCGTGTLTALLAARWPAAAVTGLDSSPEMLAQARDAHPGVTWVEGDIAAWRPQEPVDVLYANAALHWLDDHAALMPRLIGHLSPGGVLAVQMPRNFAAPSHVLMRAVADEGPWAGRINLRREPVLPPEAYYDILAPHAATLEIWESEYLQVLEGEDPVFEFVRSAGLRPVLEALEGAEREAYLDDYRARLRQAYPRRPDGRTLFPFRRLFFVARR